MGVLEQFNSSHYSQLVKLWIKAGLKLTLSDTQLEIEKFAKENPYSFYIYKLDDKIVGSVIGGFDGRRGYIHHLAVDPDYQNKGIGNILMERVTKYFEENNVVKLHIMIEKDNKEVMDYYKKFGWHVRDDIILMSKSLRNEEIEISNNKVKIINK